MNKSNNDLTGKNKKSFSKSFTEGINALHDEIQLAFQWNRPSILLAIHDTSGGQLIARQFLEKRLLKENKKVNSIVVEYRNPDVITAIRATPNHEKMVFFISGLENANQLSDGDVYRALNIHREHLVEQRVCAVFWLTETEAANLARFAPDFWAFRHRVIEFAPKRGSRSPSIPSGLFLWKEQLPWMDLDAQKKQITHEESALAQLPNENSKATNRLETILKLIHYNWDVNNSKQVSKHLKDLYLLLDAQSNLEYHGWTLNAKGIILFENGDRQGAFTCLDQALNMDPRNSTFIINSAIMAHGMGKNREAILLARRAIKNDTDNANLWHVLGFLHLFMEKPENAIEAMRMALEKDPNNIEFQYALAICYSKNGQPEICQALLAQIERGPQAQNILQSTYQRILSGKIEAALKDLHHAIEFNQINQHRLLQDPNLRALVDMPRLMSIST